ncbi:MAG: Ldh family oxidoreductase, partial [Methyloligellaceae bacterium]
DEAGDPSGSPESLYGSPKIDELPNANSGAGALRSFGEHKGSGLNFMIEILAGALTGSGLPTAPVDPDNRRVWNGLLSIYLSVANFRSEDSFAEEVRAFINFVQSSHPASGHESVLIPGEKENKLMSERSNKGLPISEVVWQEICDLLN